MNGKEIKRAGQAVACLILSALFSSLLPQKSAALPAKPVRIGAFDFSTLPVEAQFQFASQINLLIPRYLTPEQLIRSIGSEVRRPDAALIVRAAGKVTLAALKEPTVIGMQVLRDLKDMKHVLYPNPGERANQALSDVIRNPSFDAIARSNTARAIAELDLDIPTSLDNLYDGLSALCPVNASVETASYRIRVHPGADEDRLVRGSTDWTIWVTAQPRRGQANAAVLSALAKELDLPVERLRIVSGATSIDKTVIVIRNTNDESAGK